MNSNYVVLSANAEKAYTFGALDLPGFTPERQWRYVRNSPSRVVLLNGAPVGEWVDLVTWPHADVLRGQQFAENTLYCGVVWRLSALQELLTALRTGAPAKVELDGWG